MEEATANSLPRQHADNLRRILSRLHFNALRQGPPEDPPAKVKIMKVQLKTEVHAVKARPGGMIPPETRGSLGVSRAPAFALVS